MHRHHRSPKREGHPSGSRGRDSSTSRPTTPSIGGEDTGLLNVATPAQAEALLLQRQRTAGNQAVQALVAARTGRALDLQRDWPWGGEGVKTWVSGKSTERRAYEDEQKRLEEFRARGKKYPDVAPEIFTPAGGGKFRVQYVPERAELNISVKCWFNFIEDGPQRVDMDDWEKAKSERRPPHMIREMWTEDQRQQWKARFFLAVNTDWSHNFDYFCHRDWWESLRALAIVKFHEVPATEAGGADLTVNIHKGHGVRRSNVQFSGAMELNDFDVDRRGGRTAVHEAGHVLGLGDEYVDEEDPATEGREASHSKRVEAEFGHKVIRGKHNPDSIMADGVKILPEHGVTFLEAIRKVTGMSEWHMTPKPPKPMPE